MRLGVLLVGAIIAGAVRFAGGAGNEDVPQLPAMFNGVAVTTSATSPTNDMAKVKPAGYFSLQLQVAGTGTVAYVQCEARNYSTASWVPVYCQLADSVYTNRMFESYTTNSGPNADGCGLVAFGPPLARYYRLKVYATNGTVTVSGWLAVQ